MTTRALTYVLDTNVLVQAQRHYYPFDVCPGFWECLVHYAQAGRLTSIDRVKNEILKGDDNLKTWASNPARRSFFASTDVPAVASSFGEMMRWVQAQTQFTLAAKAEFANEKVADGWVIAYAKAHGLSVVTLEVYNATRQSRVPIPNVCRAFNVAYVNTFEMLRALDVRLNWTPPLFSQSERGQ
jgi:hypothetical protein